MINPKLTCGYKTLSHQDNTLNFVFEQNAYNF